MADLTSPAPPTMQSFAFKWVSGNYAGENTARFTMTHNPNGVKRDVMYTEEELVRFSNEVGGLQEKFKQQNPRGSQAEENEYVRKGFRLAHQDDEHWRDKGIDPLSLDHYYKNSYSNEKKAYAATHPNWNDNKNTYAQLGEAQPNTSAPASAIENGKAGALTRSAKISGDDYQFELSKDQKKLVGVRVMGLEGGNEQGNFVRFDEPFDPNNDEAIRNTLATARMQARQDISMAARQQALLAARAASPAVSAPPSNTAATAAPAAAPAASDAAMGIDGGKKPIPLGKYAHLGGGDIMREATDYREAGKNGAEYHIYTDKDDNVVGFGKIGSAESNQYFALDKKTKFDAATIGGIVEERMKTPGRYSDGTVAAANKPTEPAAPQQTAAPKLNANVTKNLSAVSDLAANATLLANSTGLRPWELKNVEARMQSAAKQVNAGMEAVAGGANNSANAVYKPSAVRNTTEFLTTLDKSSKLAKEKGITLGIDDKELTGFLGELDKRAQQMENSLAKLQNKAERENAAGKLSDFRKAAKNLAETRGIDTKGMRFAQAGPDKQSNDDRVAQAASEAGKPLEDGPVSLAKEEKPDGVTFNPGAGEQPGKKTALDENGKTELLTKTTTRPRREPQDGGVAPGEDVDPQSPEYARARTTAEQGMAANDNGMGTLQSQSYAMSNASQGTQKSSTTMRSSDMGVSKSQSASL